MARKADVKGGNGDVVFDAETGTARKYLRNTSTAEKVTRFKRELAVFQELCKNPIPNVVEVTDVYIDEDKIAESYVEMKKYDGSVYDILEVTKGNVKLVFELLLPVIKALYTLSTGNPPLYHRDIKPDNILFLKKDDEYTLYLTDFGTCFLNDGSERLTPETMAVGPRMYIAPEYETGRVEEVTEKGDIFSLGKVLWCMINGEPEDFMPSNFWFVDEYDLTKRFPGNADMIVACMHWGTEYQTKQNSEQEELADFLFQNGVNVIIGNHPHVIQPMEKRTVTLEDGSTRDGFVVYALGNFICDQNAVNTRDSIILNLKITKHTDGSITIDNYDYVPIYMYKDTSVSKHKMKILDINKTIYNYENNLDDSITEKIYNLMKTELGRITKILSD